MNLSPRLTLAEVTRSQTAARLGIDNTPNGDQLANLKRTALQLYEPVCDLLGYEITVSSGFRSVALNSALPGAAKTSRHLYGLALDLDPPPGVSLRDTFDVLRASNIPYDEIIEECNSWIHIALPLSGALPKREQLVMTRTNNKWQTSPAPKLLERPEAA